MTEDKIQRLLDLVKELVNEDGPWQNKMAAVEAVADEDETTCLEEFCSWFGGEE